MSRKKHIILCLDNKEHKQLKIICDERNIEVDTFVVQAIENEILRILSGNNE